MRESMYRIMYVNYTSIHKMQLLKSTNYSQIDPTVMNGFYVISFYFPVGVATIPCNNVRFERHLVSAELRKHRALHSCLGDVKAVASLYWIF